MGTISFPKVNISLIFKRSTRNDKIVYYKKKQQLLCICSC